MKRSVLTEAELLAALAEARDQARSLGRPVHIVADRRLGWRITAYLAEADSVIIRDVSPPPSWTPELETAWLTVCDEMPEAAAALARICRLVSNGPASTRISESERREVLLAFADQVARVERFREEKSSRKLERFLSSLKSVL